MELIGLRSRRRDSRSGVDELTGLLISAAIGLGVAACSDEIKPLATAEPGVVFTYPVDAQVDVPFGTRIVVTFSDPVEASALGSCSGQGDTVTGAFCLVGPNGPVDAAAEIVGDGYSVQYASPVLEAGTTYAVYVRSPINPDARNLPASGPLFRFTTRNDRPRSAAPVLVAVNGGDPAKTDTFRPMLESSTIRLVFSEPLDTRSVGLAAGSIELVDKQSGAAVPAMVIARDVHVSIDPVTDLIAGATYEVRLGSQIVDLGGQPLAPTTFTVTPLDSRGQAGGPRQVLRTRQQGDPGPKSTRSGAASNVIQIDKPLIGKEEAQLLPAALETELGDPKALGGPIAATIRRGQRIRATGLVVKLGGTIPTGLSTGDIEIEFLTDGGGRIYRNPHQDPGQRPENDRAPLYVDLSFDVAVYSVDPTGNAVLAQTVLGVQAAGTVAATDGVLAIETMTSMELGLLGVTSAPSNLVLELITDSAATVEKDQTAPALIASFPADGSKELPVDDGIELIFSEPVDLARLAAGGIQLQTGGTAVPAAIESHGSSIVLRPRVPLAYSTTYQVLITDVADVAGNHLAATAPRTFATPRMTNTSAPLTVVAAHPGAPCALTGATATSPGHCVGGADTDDLLQPFTLPSNEKVEVVFSQPVPAATLVRGAGCNTGSVRIEELDAGGACVAVVPGTLLRRDRSIAFVPDTPWATGTRYRLTLVSGSNTSCNAGEVCGINGEAANFDPLAGASAGGPNLVIEYTGAPRSPSTFMFADATPFSDINGSGTIDSGEVQSDENRAALRITGTTGSINDADFTGPDCLPGTPDIENCMYLLGSMPVTLNEVTENCPLPDGSTAASCVPVNLSAQAMYATNVALSASVGVGITIATETKTAVMRIREPAGGPVTGYIVDDGGKPTLVLQLDLFMDAPDMAVPLSAHDLHSKPLSLYLRGAVEFLPDGRISIAASNVADVPVTVAIDAPLGLSGTVKMLLPAGEMKLQLVSRPLRGAPL